MYFLYNVCILYAKSLLTEVLCTSGEDTLVQAQTRFCLFCATADARKATFFKTIIKPKIVLPVKYAELPTSKPILQFFPHYAVFHDKHHRCGSMQASNTKRKFTSSDSVTFYTILIK